MEGLFSSPWLWLVIVGGGALLIGLFMAYGQARTKNLTTGEKAARDAGTRQVYADDDQPRT